MSRDLANKEDLAQARATASQIRQGIHNYLATLALIGRAWKQEHWRVLGYKSWAEYVDGEFGEERLKLPTEHRRKAVEELRLLGMSQRAIGTALDVPQSTVRDDLQVSGSTHLEETKGTDGKTYAASRPSSPSGDGEADARPVDDSHSDDEAPTDATSVGAGETAIEGPGVSPSVDAAGEGTTTDPDGADAAGDPTDRPSAGSPVSQKFWSQISGASFVDCWVWIGRKDRGGYGRVLLPDGRETGAHRLAYAALIDEVPEGLDLDHLCRNRACVNPWHLEPVTRRVNVLRGTSLQAQNARKTHCPQGHPYDERNTLWLGTARKCRICRNAYRRAQRRRRALKAA